MPRWGGWVTPPLNADVRREQHDATCRLVGFGTPSGLLRSARPSPPSPDPSTPGERGAAPPPTPGPVRKVREELLRVLAGDRESLAAQLASLDRQAGGSLSPSNL